MRFWYGKISELWKVKCVCVIQETSVLHSKTLTLINILGYCIKWKDHIKSY